MPYVTSIERLAKSEGRVEGKIEGRVEGKIQLLQDLLGLPVMSDEALECMTAQQLEALFTELRQRVNSR